jgi:hypothetical protein
VPHGVICAAHSARGEHVSCVALSGGVFGKCVAGVAGGGYASVACVLFVVSIGQEVFVACVVHTGCAACVARSTCVAHDAVAICRGYLAWSARGVCVPCVECSWCCNVDAREACGGGACVACDVGCVPSDVACGAHFAIDCEFFGLLCWPIFLYRLCVLVGECVW